jgi:hypothetical protein
VRVCACVYVYVFRVALLREKYTGVWTCANGVCVCERECVSICIASLNYVRIREEYTGVSE